MAAPSYGGIGGPSPLLGTMHVKVPSVDT